MSVKTEATEEDLARVRGKAEIVNGRIVHMSPAGGLHPEAGLEIAMSLREYARATKTGRAASDNVAFMVELPDRKSFSPDAAYHNRRLTKKFFQGAPLFAVEIRSGRDRGPAGERRTAAKRSDYFAAGTLVVWDVNLDGEDVIRSYRAEAPDQPTAYRRCERASAEPAVPGWSMPVDDLFPPEHTFEEG
jgi:Uma2 family endonuclease